MPIGAAKRKKQQVQHLDAAESAFFARSLEVVKGRTYDIKFPALRAREFLPTATDVDPDASVIIYRQYTQVGVAQLIASYADDLPRVDVSAAEFQSKIRNLGDAYGYNIFEIRAARKAGVDLDGKKAASARRAIEVLIDRLLTTGDTATGIIGLLNQPNAQTFTVPNGAGGSPTWALKTADEILADMINVVEQIVTNTKEQEVPNTLLVPRTSYTLIRTKRLEADNLTTVLQQFQSLYPQIKVEGWLGLETAGAGATKRMVAYRNDPDAIEAIIPREFEQLDPEQRNLEQVINCIARCGGVLAYYPMAMAYGDGI